MLEFGCYQEDWRREKNRMMTEKPGRKKILMTSSAGNSESFENKEVTLWMNVHTSHVRTLFWRLWRGAGREAECRCTYTMGWGWAMVYMIDMAYGVAQTWPSLCLYAIGTHKLGTEGYMSNGTPICLV